MKLIITIDTEEDQWGKYHPTNQTTENIQQIRPLQALFDEFCAIPTYLITYPVATDPESISLLRAIQSDGRCEIGMHCHPWNTPPLEEASVAKNTMMCNLPEDLIDRKLQHLHNTIARNFDSAPTSFRAGRWGYGKNVAHALLKLGYRIDSSVCALTDWTKYHGPDFSDVTAHPYYFHPAEIFKPDATGTILEVPATVKFLQQNERVANKIDRLLRRKSPLPLLGILSRLRLLNKVSLSPELASGPDMVALMKVALKQNMPVVNLFFHSSALSPGLTSFVHTASDRSAFLNRIRFVLQFARDTGIESIRLSDAPSVVPRCA